MIYLYDIKKPYKLPDLLHSLLPAIAGQSGMLQQTIVLIAA